jgi:hypothetical protein
MRKQKIVYCFIRHTDTGTCPMKPIKVPRSLHRDIMHHEGRKGWRNIEGRRRGIVGIERNYHEHRAWSRSTCSLQRTPAELGMGVGSKTGGIHHPSQARRQGSHVFLPRSEGRGMPANRFSFPQSSIHLLLAAPQNCLCK